MSVSERRPITGAAGPVDGPPVLAPEVETDRLRLRQRWELASVLNFLKVFEPVIKNNLKISAEEIETGLIEPNNALAQLHIMLLQGIPPVSKILNGSDAWVAVLTRKLTMWWPWVAEGDFPLAAAKGEEIALYRRLDPTVRLVILKAVCEIRADQNDIVSFINDALKDGTEISTFRKNNIGGDEKGTTYWYDGSAIIGHRLYKEVNTFNCKSNVKGIKVLPTINSRWETLATNLEEFNRVVDEFSSRQSKLEVAVGKSVETEAIPALIKLHQKKERALKQHEREQRLLNGLRTSGITRSCRNRRPITYTFDAYDKAIDEAIRQTKKRKTVETKKHVRNNAPNKASDANTEFRECESSETETESDMIEDDTAEDTTSRDEYSDDRNDNDTDKENRNPGNRDHSKLDARISSHIPKGPRWSKRVAEIAPSPVPEIKKLGAKNSLGQRPKNNTALESSIVSDSEDDGNSAGSSDN